MTLLNTRHRARLRVGPTKRRKSAAYSTYKAFRTGDVPGRKMAMGTLDHTLPQGRSVRLPPAPVFISVSSSAWIDRSVKKAVRGSFWGSASRCTYTYDAQICPSTQRGRQGPFG